MRTPHTHFKRGTPLHIILRSGDRLYDHYEDHGSGYMALRKYGKLYLRSVKAVTIWKGGPLQSRETGFKTSVHQAGEVRQLENSRQEKGKVIVTTR